MNKLDSNYWENRYSENQTGWDLGDISTPIKEYIDQLNDKSISILIPGCGNGHEAEYLFKNGFNNVTLLDFANQPLIDFKKRNSDFPESNLINDDFFLHEGKYDLIIEQTLFCAIDPELREKYAQKIKDLLKPSGKLVGLLFNKEFLNGPPFGGNKPEYLNYFSKYFNSIYMEDAYNSITPRSGTELFIIIQNKKV